MADERLDAGKIRDKWDRGVRSTRIDRDQAAVNAMFLRNKQWVFWNKETGRLEEVPRTPERVRVSVSRVGPNSRLIYAKLVRRSLVFDVPPSSPDDAAVGASRLAEAALAEAHRTQRWEQIRLDHAICTWTAGVGGLCVEWDSEAGTVLEDDEDEEAAEGKQQRKQPKGRKAATGEVKVSAVSMHEMVFEPGTRDPETAYWWMRGVALPPPVVQEMYNLDREPEADARAMDYVYRDTDRANTSTPLTMVFTHFERPHGKVAGGVHTVVGSEVVDKGDWPFPFTDRLNIACSVPEPVHGRWYGHTPVTDAVPVQALYNLSWSSIGEHMRNAGNARLMVPIGSVDDVEELTDAAGEVLEYNPINGMKPGYESPPSMPDWWIRQPGMLENVLDDILTTHAVSRGEAPAGIESGIALSILSENDDTPVGALAKALSECWGRAASMVLEVWEKRVKDTRTATVRIDGSVPESITWVGEALKGQTTAIVPLDSVMPRSRAAQAAYAMQLHDRKIINTPGELAKVADLPDQDDLLAGIDPDTARAQRENRWMAVGHPRTVAEYDDHANHLRVLRSFMQSERFDNFPEDKQQIFYQHAQAHEIMAAEAAVKQVNAAAVSPIAAALPTLSPKPIPAEDLAQATDLSTAAGGAPPEGGPPAPTAPPPDVAAPPAPGGPGGLTAPPPPAGAEPPMGAPA